MTLPILPLDIYYLLLPFLPNLDCHLALSNTSSLLRHTLYPSDSCWHYLLRDFEWPYEAVRGEGKETRTAREVVIDIVGRRRCSVRIEGNTSQRCKGRMVLGFGAGSEGVLGEVVYGSICDKAKQWKYGPSASEAFLALSSDSWCQFRVVALSCTF